MVRDPWKSFVGKEIHYENEFSAWLQVFAALVMQSHEAVSN